MAGSLRLPLVACCGARASDPPGEAVRQAAVLIVLFLFAAACSDEPATETSDTDGDDTIELSTSTLPTPTSSSAPASTTTERVVSILMLRSPGTWIPHGSNRWRIEAVDIATGDFVIVNFDTWVTGDRVTGRPFVIDLRGEEPEEWRLDFPGIISLIVPF